MREAGLKVVVDAGRGHRGAGAAHGAVPRRHGGADRQRPAGWTGTATERGAEGSALEALGALVASSRADFGVRFDATAERLSLVDETGTPIDDGRALLVMLDLVAAERRGGTWRCR